MSLNYKHPVASEIVCVCVCMYVFVRGEVCKVTHIHTVGMHAYSSTFVCLTGETIFKIHLFLVGNSGCYLVVIFEKKNSFPSTLFLFLSLIFFFYFTFLVFYITIRIHWKVTNKVREMGVCWVVNIHSQCSKCVHICIYIVCVYV